MRHSARQLTFNALTATVPGCFCERGLYTTRKVPNRNRTAQHGGLPPGAVPAARMRLISGEGEGRPGPGDDLFEVVMDPATDPGGGQARTLEVRPAALSTGGYCRNQLPAHLPELLPRRGIGAVNSLSLAALASAVKPSAAESYLICGMPVGRNSQSRCSYTPEQLMSGRG